MELHKPTAKSWKGAKSLNEASELVDYGVMLSWDEARPLARTLTEDEQADLLRHVANRLAERVDMRLPFEITVETLLVLLANSSNEKLIDVFLDQLFSEPAWEEAIRSLVEISLTSEVSENHHDEDIFSMAVVLICEMGLAVKEVSQSYPEEKDRAQSILDHIATYLLSVSNTNNTCIRLSLLHYFGTVDGERPSSSFNKVMGRFGHTVLDQLFTLLFQKKTEAIALQYLLENLPFVLRGDRHCQRIFHESAKFYMLKRPERFALFVQTFSDHLNSIDQGFDAAKTSFVQHLGLLLKVASEVNHRRLACEMLTALLKYKGHPIRNEILQQFANEEVRMRRGFRDILSEIRRVLDNDLAHDSVSLLKSSKRGRKPTFSRAGDIRSIDQVAYLAQQDTIARAS